MKEFIEKLIGRLSVQMNNYESDCNYRVRKGMCALAEDCGRCGFMQSIEIVNELAEEYNGGWIPCSRELPEYDTKQYIVQKTNGLIDILGFTKDAYKLDKYDFREYKGKKKPLFYDYDSEYGYIEYECEAWMPLPEPYHQKGE